MTPLNLTGSPGFPTDGIRPGASSVYYAMNCHRVFDQTAFMDFDRPFIPMFTTRTPRTTLFLYGLLLLIPAKNPLAAEITLAWNASPSTSTAGYRLDYGTQPGRYTAGIDVGNTTRHTVTALVEGTPYYFAVKAYNPGRTLESIYSNEVGATPPVTVPTVSFSASVTVGDAPLMVSLTPAVTGSIASWVWDFGDGTRSSGSGSVVSTALKSYTLPGQYTVRLSVTHSGGTVNSALTLTVKSATDSSVPPSPDGSGSGGLTESPHPSGLVAAYGFEEAAGSLLTADASGWGNHGTLVGATPASGRFGSALQFNGYRQMVSIKDHASLDMNAAQTLEAWVYARTNRGQRPVLIKEQGTLPVYGLWSNGSRNLPVSALQTSDFGFLSGLATLPLYQWSHLATTYDGHYQRLYLNGREVARRSRSGAIAGSVGSLRIGGNPILGDWFSGLIDEVRLYDRALSASEIGNDMNVSVMTTHPPVMVLGDNVHPDQFASLSMGSVQAVQTLATHAALLNQLSIELDARSGTGPLILGLYADNQGHPGNLLASGRISRPRPGQGNTVPVKALKLSANTLYWLAILHPYSSVDSAIVPGTGLMSGLTEVSNATTLTDLPPVWRDGIAKNANRWAEQGLGYSSPGSGL